VVIDGSGADEEDGAVGDADVGESVGVGVDDPGEADADVGDPGDDESVDAGVEVAVPVGAGALPPEVGPVLPGDAPVGGRPHPPGEQPWTASRQAATAIMAYFLLLEPEARSSLLAMIPNRNRQWRRCQQIARNCQKSFRRVLLPFTSAWHNSSEPDGLVINAVLAGSRLVRASAAAGDGFEGLAEVAAERMDGGLQCLKRAAITGTFKYAHKGTGKSR
jgi:hypothetical protein